MAKSIGSTEQDREMNWRIILLLQQTSCLPQEIRLMIIDYLYVTTRFVLDLSIEKPCFEFRLDSVESWGCDQQVRLMQLSNGELAWPPQQSNSETILNRSNFLRCLADIDDQKKNFNFFDFDVKFVISPGTHPKEEKQLMGLCSYRDASNSKLNIYTVFTDRSIELLSSVNINFSLVRDNVLYSNGFFTALSPIFASQYPSLVALVNLDPEDVEDGAYREISPIFKIMMNEMHASVDHLRSIPLFACPEKHCIIWAVPIPRSELSSLQDLKEIVKTRCLTFNRWPFYLVPSFTYTQKTDGKLKIIVPQRKNWLRVNSQCSFHVTWNDTSFSSKNDPFRDNPLESWGSHANVVGDELHYFEWNTVTFGDFNSTKTSLSTWWDDFNPTKYNILENELEISIAIYKISTVQFTWVDTYYARIKHWPTAPANLFCKKPSLKPLNTTKFVQGVYFLRKEHILLVQINNQVFSFKPVR